MSNSGSNDFSLLMQSDKQKQQQKIDNEKIDNKKNEFQSELDARLILQEKVMGKFRKPESSPMGGLVHKYMHLADLNVETLAGQTIAMILYDILSFMLQHEHRLDIATYEEAEKSGIAYTGDGQTIYKMGENGKPDFGKPYPEGEKPSLTDIYKNGYVPEADLKMSVLKEMGQAIQGFSGVKPMGEDLAIQMFGVNATNRAFQDVNKKHGSDVEDRMVAKPPGSSGP